MASCSDDRVSNQLGFVIFHLLPYKKLALLGSKWTVQHFQLLDTGIELLCTKLLRNLLLWNMVTEHDESGYNHDIFHPEQVSTG